MILRLKTLMRVADGSKVILLFIINSHILEINNPTILHMMTSSRDKGFIQIWSEYWRVPTTTTPLQQMNRLVWHYSPGIYRSVNVCIALRQEQRSGSSAWPWFARINWKNYHSIISICATSLCKRERGAGPESDRAHLQRRGGANGGDRALLRSHEMRRWVGHWNGRRRFLPYL